jgi:hypothetical protein
MTINTSITRLALIAWTTAIFGLDGMAADKPLKVYILAGHEIAGFVWFQGWNDMCDGHTYPERHKPGGYAEYSRLMAHFIRNVRGELAAPKMRFVIGVIYPALRHRRNRPQWGRGHGRWEVGRDASVDQPM